MAQQFTAKHNVAYTTDIDGLRNDPTTATPRSLSPWPAPQHSCMRKPFRRERSDNDASILPTAFRDPLFRSQVGQWEQEDVIEHAQEQLRYGLEVLDLEPEQAEQLVVQFADTAEQWLFIGHHGEIRTRCRQELHSNMGAVLSQAWPLERLEAACQLLSEAWLWIYIWDGSTAKLSRTFRALQQEIRLCLAYSVVKASVRDSAMHLMLYISACSPQSPFFAELDTRLQSVAEDTAEVVKAIQHYFSSVLDRRNSATGVH